MFCKQVFGVEEKNTMNLTQKEEQGHRLMAEADKKITSRSRFFRSLRRPSVNKWDLAETYLRAANAFKLAKSWEHAGKALEKAAVTYATISLEQGGCWVSSAQYDAATKYADAGKTYEHVNAEKAIECLEKAIDLYGDAGYFQQCALLKNDTAELYLAMNGDNGYKSAMLAYSAAADYYVMDNAKYNADCMRVKWAALRALAGEYAPAAEMYERIAQMALASNLLKYEAREHLLRAGLCRLCQGDVGDAERAVSKYGDLDTSFSSSREGRLLSGVFAAVTNSDIAEFRRHFRAYSSVSSLGNWEARILHTIKNRITNQEVVEDDTPTA